MDQSQKLFLVLKAMNNAEKVARLLEVDVNRQSFSFCPVSEVKGVVFDMRFEKIRGIEKDHANKEAVSLLFADGNVRGDRSNVLADIRSARGKTASRSSLMKKAPKTGSNTCYVIFRTRRDRQRFLTLALTINPRIVQTVSRPTARWIPDSTATTCMMCARTFNLLLRKHHCRICGFVVCERCSPHKVNLSYSNTHEALLRKNGVSGLLDRVKSKNTAPTMRACTKCFTKLEAERLAGNAAFDDDSSGNDEDEEKVLSQEDLMNLNSSVRTDTSSKSAMYKRLAAVAETWVAEEKLKRRWKEYLRINPNLTRSEELKRLVRRGIPNSMRGEVWQVMGQVKRKRSQFHGNYYQGLLQKARTAKDAATLKIGKIIEKDVLRTLRVVEGESVDTLRRILFAYALHNPHIGYCQSLNFLASVLLVVMKEESAFWMLTVLAEDLAVVCDQLPSTSRYNSVPVLRHRDPAAYAYYYAPSMGGLKIDQEVLEDLVRLKLPKVSAALQTLGVPLAPLTVNWFMCFYFNTLPIACMLRVWDCLFYEGPKIMFRAGLTILHMNADAIVKCTSVTDLMQCLSEFSNMDVDPDRFLQKMTDLTWIGSFPGSQIVASRKAIKASMPVDLREVKTTVQMLPKKNKGKTGPPSRPPPLTPTAVAAAAAAAADAAADAAGNANANGRRPPPSRLPPARPRTLPVPSAKELKPAPKKSPPPLPSSLGPARSSKHRPLPRRPNSKTVHRHNGGKSVVFWPTRRKATMQEMKQIGKTLNRGILANITNSATADQRRLYARCKECNKNIPEGEAVFALGHSWHKHHFVCAGPCKKPLAAQEFRVDVMQNKPYCTQDFRDIFGLFCAVCDEDVYLPSTAAQEEEEHKTSKTRPYGVVSGSIVHEACCTCTTCGKLAATSVEMEVWSCDSSKHTVSCQNCTT